MRPEEQDPYTPPPRYKMRSGGALRFIVLAALLGAAAWGYIEFSKQPQTASLVPPAQQEEQLADSGYQVQEAPVATAPATTPAPAATERNTSRPPPVETPAEPTPAPSVGTPPAG